MKKKAVGIVVICILAIIIIGSRIRFVNKEYKNVPRVSTDAIINVSITNDVLMEPQIDDSYERTDLHVKGVSINFFFIHDRFIGKIIVDDVVYKQELLNDLSSETGRFLRFGNKDNRTSVLTYITGDWSESLLVDIDKNLYLNY